MNVKKIAVITSLLMIFLSSYSQKGGSVLLSGGIGLPSGASDEDVKGRITVPLGVKWAIEFDRGFMAYNLGYHYWGLKANDGLGIEQKLNISFLEFGSHLSWDELNGVGIRMGMYLPLAVDMGGYEIISGGFGGYLGLTYLIDIDPLWIEAGINTNLWPLSVDVGEIGDPASVMITPSRYLLHITLHYRLFEY